MSEYSEHIKSILNQAEAQDTLVLSYEQQIRQLAEYKRQAQEKSAQLKQDVIDLMLAEGDLGPVHVGEHLLTLRRNPPKVVLTGDVPDAYMRVKEVREPDKARIKIALQDGEGLGFAHIEQGYSIKLTTEV